MKLLLDAETVAELLDFKSMKAFYAAAERGQIPGKVKLGSRLRFKAAAIYKLAGATLPDGKDSPSEEE
jgi:predicted DNA-binding transcriptional regulator AlpA